MIISWTVYAICAASSATQTLQFARALTLDELQVTKSSFL